MTHIVVAPWGTHHQGQKKMISLTFQKLVNFYLLSVCSGLNYYFCNCVYPLLEVEDPKWTLLRATISTNHRLSSTDQNWRSYWSLTFPKKWCSRPNSNHFREDRRFSRQYLFSPPLEEFTWWFFSPGVWQRPHREKNSDHLGPSHFWENKSPLLVKPIPHTDPFFCTLGQECNLIFLS